MRLFLSRLFNNSLFKSFSLLLLAGLGVSIYLFKFDKVDSVLAFLQKQSVVTLAHAENSIDSVNGVHTGNTDSTAAVDSSSKVQADIQKRKRITRDELPKNWPESLREHVAQFDHPDSEYWRDQIQAHENQARTPGWLKFESYAIEKNRDVLALPTFEQMELAERSDEFLLVQVQNENDLEVLNQFGLIHEQKLGGKLLSGLHRFRYEKKDDIQTLLDQVNAHENVIFAEPDYLTHPSLVPSDPNIGPSEWWLDQINAYDAWDIATDASAIGPVAVYDNGILVTHEDLADNMWVNTGEIAGNGLDDDGNGFIDDVNGIVVVDDSMWHGTSVAGTICGQGDNGIGYVGSAWDCQLMELRTDAPSLISSITVAIPYAIEHGARVSNHSWGSSALSQTLADVVDVAETEGHLMIVAAGNRGQDNDSASNYPSNLPNDNILAVAASTTDESRIFYSSWGATSVDIAAPTEFNTADETGGYSQFGGTSQATPVVTGAVALAWSQNPSLTFLEIKQRVLDSARPVALWSGLTVTGGILDMEALLLSIDPDTDGDGRVNSVDPDDDNDGVLDEADAFPLDPTETTDSDGDGVGDNSDLYPLDPTESADSDGDGVGDNADVFPNDPSETTDTDGDGVGDNSDPFPNDASEWLDSDGDGVGDNADPDRDNDGIANLADGGFVFTPSARQITVTGGSDSQLIDLSVEGYAIGDQVTISSVFARGDLGASASEYFTINVNAGEYVSPNLVTGVECGPVLAAVSPAVGQQVSIIDIGGGVPGVSVSVTASSGVNNICSGINLALEYQFTLEDGLLPDGDSDGIENDLDLDSDGDGWPDIVEVGLLDVNGDYRIDELADEAIITIAPDDDADGIPNHLDLESTNALNDGTAYDIYLSGYAALDSNGDGRVNALDSGAGIDANNNGIDDLVESSVSQPDNDRDGYPDGVDVFPLDPSEWIDTDGDGIGDNGDAFPADPTETLDNDGDGIGNNTDSDNDNDGIPDSTEYSTSSSADILAWPVLGPQLTVEANSITFNDGGSVFPRQANSVPVSTYGFSDNYRVSWVINSASTEYGFGIGLGVIDTGADMFDIDYGFWVDSGTWGTFDNSAFHDVWGNFTNGTSVFAIEVDGTQLRYLVDGMVLYTAVLSSTPDFYVDTVFFAGDLSINDFVVESLSGASTGEPDEDGDSVDNVFDLDSDNDSIPDVVEAGLVDANGDLMVDVLADQGSVSTPPDSDLDGIPDFLDLESLNPANDGTAYDIASTVFAVLDTTGDGVLTSADAGGGFDANGNGVDDLFEGPNTDGDAYPDIVDDFPTDPTEWIDSDGDGVGDNSDVFPADPTESADTDGDGVGDNADAFPSDPNETADSDGDGIGDNTDTFPSDPSEFADSDLDGIGNNSDIDDDNDGVADTAEQLGPRFSMSPALGRVEADFGSHTQSVDLSALGVGIGEFVRVSGLIARGDLDSSNENFTLDINSGEWTSSPLTTGSQCASSMQVVTPAVNVEVRVQDIGGGVPGIALHAQASNQVHSLCGLSPRYALEYLLGVSVVNTDRDGRINIYDLDSDNDSIPDVIEAGLVDSNGDFIVDDLALQGTVTSPIDTDGDGLPDFIDLESTNPLNDGTAFDIATTGFVSFDSNGDGLISGLDVGGGIDLNDNGVDDLVEFAPDADGDGYPDSVDAFPADPTEWNDSDLDGVGDNGDAFPNDPSETLDSDGDGVGDNGDVFPSDPTESADSDSDGVGDNADVFPNDPSETVDSDGDGVGDNGDAFPNDASESADTDGDGVGDNADAFPSDPSETTDTDGDGTGDNTDIDIDNDGIENAAEGASSADITDWPSLGSEISADGNNLLFDFDGNVFPRQANSAVFSSYGFADDYQVSWTFNSLAATHAAAVGLGETENGADLFDIEYGFFYDAGTWGTYDNGAFHDVWGDVIHGVTTFGMEITGGQVNYLVDGIIVHSVALSSPPDFYIDSVFFIGDINVDDFVLEPLGGPIAADSDTDSDGIDNAFDLDSDNDTIPDIVEAGLVDADGNYMVDVLSDQATITVAPDSDADGLPDHLDLESLNPANDGTAFDILTGAFGALDTNGDGQLNSSDIGGGVDANSNGVDDLIEP